MNRCGRGTNAVVGLRWLVGVALAGALLVSVGTSAQASFPGANGKIAFSSARDGNYEIYSMDPDGGGVTRLTENLQGDFEPAFSADGLSLAFTRGGTSGAWPPTAAVRS